MPTWYLCEQKWIGHKVILSDLRTALISNKVFLTKLCLGLEIKKVNFPVSCNNSGDICDRAGVDDILKKFLSTFPLNGEKKK